MFQVSLHFQFFFFFLVSPCGSDAVKFQKNELFLISRRYQLQIVELFSFIWQNACAIRVFIPANASLLLLWQHDTSLQVIGLDTSLNEWT